MDIFFVLLAAGLQEQETAGRTGVAASGSKACCEEDWEDGESRG